MSIGVIKTQVYVELKKNYVPNKVTNLLCWNVGSIFISLELIIAGFINHNFFIVKVRCIVMVLFLKKILCLLQRKIFKMYSF